MDLAEDDVHVLMNFISVDEVKETTRSWVPDIGSVHGRFTQYLKTVDIYSHLKTLLGRFLLEYHEAR
jgi:hypothetical protein